MNGTRNSSEATERAIRPTLTIGCHIDDDEMWTLKARTHTELAGWEQSQARQSDSLLSASFLLNSTLNSRKAMGATVM
jgi:hypothetical protein